MSQNFYTKISVFLKSTILNSGVVKFRYKTEMAMSINKKDEEGVSTKTECFLKCLVLIKEINFHTANVSTINLVLIIS